jgi:hypothetical protein
MRCFLPLLQNTPLTFVYAGTEFTFDPGKTRQGLYEHCPGCSLSYTSEQGLIKLTGEATPILSGTPSVSLQVKGKSTGVWFTDTRYIGNVALREAVELGLKAIDAQVRSKVLESRARRPEINAR